VAAAVVDMVVAAEVAAIVVVVAEAAATVVVVAEAAATVVVVAANVADTAVATTVAAVRTTANFPSLQQTLSKERPGVFRAVFLLKTKVWEC
jgi:hypothetical protein